MHVQNYFHIIYIKIDGMFCFDKNSIGLFYYDKYVSGFIEKFGCCDDKINFQHINKNFNIQEIE